LVGYAVNPFDGDHVIVSKVHDPVPADPQAVVPAAMESLPRIRVLGQSGDCYADGAHAILVSQVTVR
jgi:hypothetical protein